MKRTEIKTIQSVTRTLVLRALGWDDLQLGEFVFVKGIEYLENYCGHDDEVVSQYAKHALFWKWYKNHWHNRDVQFLQDIKGMHQADKVAEYHYVHNMKGFRYRPHKAIMERTMYQDVIYPITHSEGVIV